MSLCTLSNVKDYLGIVGAKATDDNVIEELINNVSTEIETYINRSILSTETTEYNNGDKQLYFLSNTPITSISGMWSSTNYTFNEDAIIDAADYTNTEDALIMKNYKTTAGNKTVKIVYTGGYTTTPLDLKQVCVEETGRKFKNRTSFDITARSTGDGNVTYVEKGFLKKNLLVMNKYKWIGLC